MKAIKPLIIIFLLICSSSFGQSGKLKRADRLYNSFSFVKAIEKYENLIDKNLIQKSCQEMCNTLLSTYPLT